MATKPIPTLFEWAGGMPALERLTQRFYDKVRQDQMLAPIFAQMSSEHPRLAVLNSQPGAAADPKAPMPHWNWGPPGGPYQP